MSDSEPPDASPRVLAANIGSYPELVDAFRARAQERRIPVGSAAVNQLGGCADGFLAKLLAVKPVKRVGMQSLHILLQILGARLQLVEDPAAVVALSHRLPIKNESFSHSTAIVIRTSRPFLRKIGKIGAQVRWQADRKMRTALSMGGKNSRKNMTRRQASELGRKAALARWNGGNGNGAANGR
jgi:hypothetical protein